MHKLNELESQLAAFAENPLDVYRKLSNADVDYLQRVQFGQGLDYLKKFAQVMIEEKEIE